MLKKKESYEYKEIRTLVSEARTNGDVEVSLNVNDVDSVLNEYAKMVMMLSDIHIILSYTKN